MSANDALAQVEEEIKAEHAANMESIRTRKPRAKSIKPVNPSVDEPTAKENIMSKTKTVRKPRAAKPVAKRTTKRVSKPRVKLTDAQKMRALEREVTRLKKKLDRIIAVIKK